MKHVTLLTTHSDKILLQPAFKSVVSLAVVKYVIRNAMKQVILLTNLFRWTQHSIYPTEARFQVCYTCCCQMFICNAMKHVTLLTHSFRWNPTTARVQICCYTCCCQIFHLQRHETSYSTNKLVQMNPTEAHFQVCYTCCCQMFICNTMKHVTLLINPFRWNPTKAFSFKLVTVIIKSYSVTWTRKELACSDFHPLL